MRAIGLPRRRGGHWTARRLFASYAAVTLVPVLVLGILLAQLLRHQADDRGRSEGVAEAKLVARTAVAPLLDGDVLTTLGIAEYHRLQHSVSSAISEQQILRLHLRNLAGTVIFPRAANPASGDNSRAEPVDDEALDASHGETVARVTRLNADDPALAAGPRVVEVYLPLTSAQTGERIGVLEIYLPYEPIAAAIAKGQRTLLLALVAGLALLWLCLIGVTASVVRNLRRETAAHAHLAEHDALTGLPNRERMVRALNAVTTDPEDTVFVAVLAVRRFRQLANALGPTKADAVLVTLAQRLRKFVGDGDRVARVGGADFAVAIAVVAGTEREWAQRLRAAAREPVLIDGLPVAIDVSIGYESTCDDVVDPEVLAHAAVALTAAQRGSEPVLRYAADQEQHDASAVTLVAEIGVAIATDQLVLHYQPKFDLESGAAVSVEALVRWQHPARGLLFPSAFLDAVEQTELIDDLTSWVVREACAAVRSIDPDVRVAVNISARSLAREGFAHHLIDLIKAEHTDPSRLILEITETAVVADPRRARTTLMQLRAYGFAISIDDFGAGQTSLQQLVAMPIDELKIDRAFVTDMDTNPRNAAVVRAVVELGHSLGISVTAEGVETIGVARALAGLGCDVAQGYYFCAPRSLDDLPAVQPGELATPLAG